jgi:Bacterial Ig domain/Immunoglobulin domain/Purple acid Phosphatase, N-terminal domain/Immunoglobulin I-set domain
MHRRVVFLFALLLAGFGFVGCSGLIAGNNGSPPPTTLTITNVLVASTTASSCQVDWTTSVSADSVVDYGTTTSYGSTSPVDQAMVTSHQIALSGLAPGTIYYYQVRSTDSKSNTAHSGGNSFKTSGGAPSITSQPASQTVTAGQTASFSVAATGTAPLTYQWKKNGAVISGSTSSSYTTPATTSSDNGAQFTVLVSNSAGSATSSAATLTVSAAPVAPSITTQPVGQTVTAGQTASFSVAATGTAPLTYQWKKNGAVIPGATSSSYTTPATTSSDNGAQFTVLVSNSAGSATSSAATLTVNAAPVAPSITTQPVGQTVTAGQTASFSVAATGTAPLTYQWKKNGAVISGATSSSYTTPATTSSDNGAQFTVLVSNSAGSATSSAATLTVSAAPVAPSITTQPASQTLTAGQTASFSVAAMGTAPLTYQWKKNGTVISGATSSSYTTPATTSSDNGAQFTVVVSNSAGSATSSVATLTVNAATPPSVAITSPTNGSTQSGTITVAGTASDVVGVSAVQVQIDGGTFSSASGTTNWSFGLDTASLSNAAHTISARATNVTGLTATTTVTFNVANGGSIINVLNYGATGNGSTNDTAAINNAIAALQPGDTLLFPCTSSSTYLLSSQLSLSTSNVTVDGSNCTVIHNTSSGAVMVIGGSGNGNPNYSSPVALSATANELATTFTTVSSLGVAAGDYVLLQQGGKDSSNGSGDTGCDPSGCRGEVLKVAYVSSNTITVTTALHDTYDPSVNGATAQKILSPLTGMTVKNITFDGNGSNVYGLEIAGVAESTVTGVTSRNVQGAALLNRGDFNVAWSNITVTGAGSAQCGSAVWFEKQGNLSINGMSISNENQGASGTGCLYNGAFGFELQASANSTITNLTVDAAGAYGRPFKTSAARYNTFNSPTVKNGVQNYNGISLEYYSSHNTYNSCVVTNNGAGTGTANGNAGINTFGNFNQYNTFINCTVSGNGNLQLLFNSYDALRLGQDSNNTVNGGTYTGTNSIEPVIEVEGANVYIHNATINGSGFTGIGFNSYGTNGCINNNAFTSGTGLGGAINSSSNTNIGSGNILSGLSSNLTPGTCGPSGVGITISPTTATVASGAGLQFTATVTGSANTAVTWSAGVGSVSSVGLFTAPIVSANTTATVTATSQADASQTASGTVTVAPTIPPNTFGYAVQGATVGSTMSNSVTATRYQMAAQNGTVTSMSVFIASPVSASPNNQFQVAIYADNNGTPGALLASSVSQTITADAWNTVSISASVTANAYYWLAYNTNGLATNTNNLRYDVGGATSKWITSEPFGAWPSAYGPVAGTSTYSASIYATYQ